MFQPLTELQLRISWGADLLTAFGHAMKMKLEWHLVANCSVSMYSPLLVSFHRFWVTCSYKEDSGFGVLSDGHGPHLQSSCSATFSAWHHFILKWYNDLEEQLDNIGVSMCTHWNVSTPQCLKEMLTSTLPWGGILGDTKRKKSLKTPRLESLDFWLSPIMRRYGAAQGVAFQHILFQGNAVVRSRANDGWLSFGT